MIIMARQVARHAVVIHPRLSVLTTASTARQLVRQSRAERTYILLRSSSKSYYVQARFDTLKFECCDAVMSPPSVYPTLTSCRWSMRQMQEKIYIKGGRKRPTSLSSHLSILVFVSYVYRVLDHIPLYFSGTPPAHNSAH